MVVSKTAVENRINSLISVGSLTVTETAQLSGSYDILENGVLYDIVATTASLPSAVENTGRWIYVQDIKKLLVSNGYEWSNNVETDQSNILNIMYAWGSNSSGALALNDAVNRSQPTIALGGTAWSTVFGGGGGIKTDGTLWRWGYNFLGNVGNNTSGNAISSPVQEISSSANWSKADCNQFGITAAIKTDGTLWSWGNGSNGALGTNDIVCYSSPVQEASTSTNWSEVSCGNTYAAAIKSDGTLWSWGANGFGNLGTNNTTSYSSPVQETSSSSTWSKISSGFNHTVAIKTDGTLWSWGRNNLGQLGTNNVTCYSSPVQETSSSTDWAEVSCASEFTVAIKTDGTLWAWGYNLYGTLGTNNTTCYSSPVQEVSSSTNWSIVDCSSGHTSAIKTDGTLWGWGFNSSGQLGTNNTTCYSSPVQETTSSTNWSKISANARDSSTYGIQSITTGFSEA